MQELAFAKINLALHVRAREPDGYHRIETIFAFAEDGDRLSVSEGEGLSLRLTGPFAPGLEAGAGNLVVRAAETLRHATGTNAGAALLLDKRLPVASGLGGGSADAAAALRLLVRWWRLSCSQAELEEIGRGLGADVAACVRSTLVRGEGRGDVLVPVDDPSLDGRPLLLVNPRVPLSTQAVFAAWEGKDQGPLAQGRTMDSVQSGRNDLEQSATALAPAVGEVLRALSGDGAAELVRMSGSGASCFGLYGDQEARDSAAKRIAADHPDWWQLKTRIRVSGAADD